MKNAFIECLKILTHEGRFIEPSELSASDVERFQKKMATFSREALMEAYRKTVAALIAFSVQEGILQDAQRPELQDMFTRVCNAERGESPERMIDGATALEMITEAELCYCVFGRAEKNQMGSTENLAFNRVKIYERALDALIRPQENHLIDRNLTPLLPLLTCLEKMQNFYMGNMDNVFYLPILNQATGCNTPLEFYHAAYAEFYQIAISAELPYQGYALLENLDEKRTFQRFSSDTTLATFAKLNNEQIATLLLEEVEPLRASEDRQYLVRQFIAKHPRETKNALTHLEHHYSDDVVISKKIPCIESMVRIEQQLERVVNKILDSDDCWDLPDEKHNEITRNLAKFRTAARKTLDTHRMETNVETLCSLVLGDSSIESLMELSSQNCVKRLRQETVRMELDLAADKILNLPKYKMQPLSQREKIQDELSTFKNNLHRILAQQNNNLNQETLYPQIKKAAHSAFSNRDFVKRLLADIAMILLCFVGVGFGIGIGRKLGGTTFFFSNNKTNREILIENEVGALFKPGEPR